MKHRVMRLRAHLAKMVCNLAYWLHWSAANKQARRNRKERELNKVEKFRDRRRKWILRNSALLHDQ